VKTKILSCLVLVSAKLTYTQTKTWNFIQAQRPFSSVVQLMQHIQTELITKKAWHDIRAYERMQRAAITGYFPHIELETGAGTSSGKDLFAPQRYVIWVLLSCCIVLQDLFKNIALHDKIPYC